MITSHGHSVQQPGQKPRVLDLLFTRNHLVRVPICPDHLALQELGFGRSEPDAEGAGESSCRVCVSQFSPRKLPKDRQVMRQGEGTEGEYSRESHFSTVDAAPVPSAISVRITPGETFTRCRPGFSVATKSIILWPAALLTISKGVPEFSIILRRASRKEAKTQANPTYRQRNWALERYAPRSKHSTPWVNYPGSAPLTLG